MNAKKIVFFNHKGGVSKTTTVYNLGWKLAEMGYKVLLVDADSHCNLTSLILRDQFDDFYTNEETKSQNIKDGVAPVFRGQSKPLTAVTCPQPAENTNLFLLAGHPTLSEWDIVLNFAQVATTAIPTLANLPGAYNNLIELTCKKYTIDYVLIDLNSNLSATNQNFFMLSDAFIIPTNPDPFSKSTIETLGTFLPKCAKWKDTHLSIFQDAYYKLPAKKPKFLGSVVNNFNVNNQKLSNAVAAAITNIEAAIKNDFIPAIKKSNQTELLLDNYGEKYAIAEIPDFQGLMFKSHYIGKPVFALTDEDLHKPEPPTLEHPKPQPTTGNVLETYKTLRSNFNIIFDNFANKFLELCEQL